LGTGKKCYPKEKIITEKTIVLLEELSFVLDKLEENVYLICNVFPEKIKMI
jgi:hypothetical protein